MGYGYRRKTCFTTLFSPPLGDLPFVFRQDTAGQEKFSRISSYYSKGAQAAIVAFDLTDKRTFDNLSDYIAFLREAEKSCYIILIGTKLDVVNEDPAKRQVTEEMATGFAANYSAPYFETSAKDGLNVTSVFDTIGYHCLAARLSALAESTAAPVSKPPHPKPPSFEGALAIDQDSARKPCCVIQ